MPTPISNSDRDLLTRTILSEAGPNASPVEQAAIAHVVLNRLNAGSAGGYGDSVQGVVLQKNAFEPWSLPKDAPNNPTHFDPNSPAYQGAATVVDGVLNGKMPDPTNGADHFLQPNIVADRVRSGQMQWPSWAQGNGQRIGSHEFFSSPQTQASSVPSDADAMAYFKNNQANTAAPTAVPSDQQAQAYFAKQQATAPVSPGASQPISAPPGSVPTPPSLGGRSPIGIDVATGQTWQTPAAAADSLARGQQGTGETLMDPVKAVRNAVLSQAAAGGERFNQALPDWVAGKPATAIGDIGMGAAGVMQAPFHGIGEAAAQVTGSPQIGQNAELASGLLLPGPKAVGAINDARPTVQGLNELVQSVPSDELDATISRLEANPKLSLADVSPQVRNIVQGLATQTGQPWQSFLDQVAKQRGRDAYGAVTSATNTLGVSDSAYNTLQGIMEKARETGQKLIQPAVENADPVPLKPLLSALDRQIKSPEAIAGETPRIPLTPTQQQLLSIRNDITNGEMAPLSERVKLSLGPINDAIKSGTLGDQRMADFTEARRLLNSANRGYTSEEDLIPALKKLADNQKIVGPIDNALAMIKKGPTEYRSADFLHGIQTRLRETADTLKNSSSGSDRLMSNDLYGARDTVVNSIDKASGGTYRPALSQYRDDMQVREAFDRGMGIQAQRGGETGVLEDSPQAWHAWAKNASPDELNAARAGALADIQRRIAQASKPVREETSGAPIPNIDQLSRARYETLFGKEKTDQFVQQLKDERDRTSLNQVLFGGSQTAHRQAANEAVAPPAVRGGPSSGQATLNSLLMGGLAEVGGHMIGAPEGIGPAVAAATRIVPPIYNKVMSGIDAARWRLRNQTMATHAVAEGSDREPVLDLLRNRQATENAGSPYKLSDLLTSPVTSALPR